MPNSKKKKKKKNPDQLNILFFLNITFKMFL